MATIIKFSILILSLSSLWLNIFAKTVRHAKVRVINEYGSPIYGVKVIHKYSDNYVDIFAWDLVKPDEKSSVKGSAKYHTGWLTTGKDWWKVIWIAEGRLLTTEPNNLRRFFDSIEKAWDIVGPGVLSAVAGAGGFLAAGPAGAAAAGGATWAIMEANEGLTNNGATAGFKQHILRSEDDGQITDIIVRRHEVVFRSRSGTSSTQGIETHVNKI